MSLPRRSLRHDEATIARYQLGAPETTSGWDWVNKAQATVLASEQADT